MIGRLRGQLAHVGEETVLVETGGVGYEVQVPASTRQALPPVGQEVTLWCRVYLREDDLRLFGFASLVERELFDHLLSISGVGPRLALAVLSTYSPTRFVQAVLRNDVGALTQIPGVGRKTAERWLLELRGRLPKALLAVAGARGAAEPIPTSPAGRGSGAREGRFGEGEADGVGPGADSMAEAHAALLALGYSNAEADGVLRELLAEGLVALSAPAEVWVKEALRRLAARLARH
ncbi:MAG: Holliday junction branch migration protein RuvA [Limnochordales bacterium]|nr:Holliday junction branch migration protein RuvA [Limnochordales bacterium]